MLHMPRRTCSRRCIRHSWRMATYSACSENPLRSAIFSLLPYSFYPLLLHQGLHIEILTKRLASSLQLANTSSAKAGAPCKCGFVEAVLSKSCSWCLLNPACRAGGEREPAVSYSEEVPGVGAPAHDRHLPPPGPAQGMLLALSYLILCLTQHSHLRCAACRCFLARV